MYHPNYLFVKSIEACIRRYMSCNSNIDLNSYPDNGREKAFSLPLSELLSFRPTLLRACLRYFRFDPIETIGRKRIPLKTPTPVCPIPNTLRLTHLSEESHF